MNKKKALLIGLILTLSVFTLVGCSNKEKPTTQETVQENVLSDGVEPIVDRVGLGFDMSSNTKKHFTIYGTTEGIEEFYYNSALINQKLLASNDTKIIYNSSIDHNLVLLAEDGTKGNVSINGQDYSFNKNNELIVELSAGEYTITSTSVDLCYILIYERNDTIEVELETGTIAFSLSDVLVDEQKDYTIYTFQDGTELQVNNDGTTEILKYGDNDLFGLEDQTLESETVEEITEITEEVMDEVVEELTEENSTEDTNNTIEN